MKNVQTLQISSFISVIIVSVCNDIAMCICLIHLLNYMPWY